MRIFTAAVGTETDSFSPIPTGLESFREYLWFEPGTHPAEARFFTGPLVAARERAGAEGHTLIEGLQAFAAPAGVTSAAAWRELRGRVLAELEAALPVDIVLLSLHGAMIAEGCEDCEGDLLQAIRARVGPRVVIGAELDPHCHLTERMVEAADLLVLYKEYPHTDTLERARELVDLALRTARGEIRPVTAVADCRMIALFHTPREPVRGFVDRMKALEGRDGILSISLAHGFPWGDVPDLGAKVLVVADADPERARTLAERLAREVRAMRGNTTEPTLDLDEGLDRALAAPRGPVVLADTADNAGGGAPSDSTFFLARLLERRVERACLGPLWDPVAVRFCHLAGPGGAALAQDRRQSRPDLRPAARRRGRGPVGGRRCSPAVRPGLDPARRRGGHPRGRRRGALERDPHPSLRPCTLHRPRNRPRRQEARGRQIHAAFPRRLRADRRRDPLDQRPGCALPGFRAATLPPCPAADLALGSARAGLRGCSRRKRPVTLVPLPPTTVHKPAVSGSRGLVAAQSLLAARAGVEILEAGGNAVDAAIATGFALGVVEPWMSGLGGGGAMLVRLAREGRAFAIDMGMVAPRRLDPADYPLTGRPGGDLFGWPEVLGNRNLEGPLSICVPTWLAGIALAHERFGKLPWRDLLAPAIALAREGLAVDWYASLMISSAAASLARQGAAGALFLPGGHPPVPAWTGEPAILPLDRLASTLERLAEAGPADFYRGELARELARDLAEIGARLDGEDLAACAATIRPPLEIPYRDATVLAMPGLFAGVTLARVLELLTPLPLGGAEPDAEAYRAYATALRTAQAERLATLGDTGPGPSCTSHLCVVDREGNLVALTQTLLSLFGSKVLSPRTGVLLNNGVMWFDPRPGPAEQPGPRQAAARQHVPGDRALARPADRPRRLGRKAHPAGGRPTPLLPPRLPDGPRDRLPQPADRHGRSRADHRGRPARRRGRPPPRGARPGPAHPAPRLPAHLRLPERGPARAGDRPGGRCGRAGPALGGRRRRRLIRAASLPTPGMGYRRSRRREPCRAGVEVRAAAHRVVFGILRCTL
jgi:microcystin degradation protein MlrC/gamma-glutamyltranspeptidase